MNISSTLRPTALNSQPVARPQAEVTEQAPTGPADMVSLSADQEKRSAATKVGMAVAAVGCTVAGFHYGGLLGGLFGMGTGSSIAYDIADAKPDMTTSLLAGAAGTGVIAAAGHYFGFLGVLIAGGVAAGAAKFVMS